MKKKKNTAGKWLWNKWTIEVKYCYKGVKYIYVKSSFIHLLRTLFFHGMGDICVEFAHLLLFTEGHCDCNA